MDAFLVPISADHHVLYCESAPFDPSDADTNPKTLWSRAVAVFRRMLAEGEEERYRPASEPAVKRGRMRRWITTRLAEAVAEQRLLWYLRKESSAGLVHPDDLPAERAMELTRAQLSRDFSRHLRWCAIDALLAIACIPIAIVPGPNVVGYYFLFRAIGHLYSLRGARHGLRDVSWQCRPTPHLTRLRQALGRSSPDRETQIQAAADALGLDRLALFVRRAAPAAGV
jgi:hypothetical protein